MCYYPQKAWKFMCQEPQKATPASGQDHRHVGQDNQFQLRQVHPTLGHHHDASCASRYSTMPNLTIFSPS